MAISMKKAKRIRKRALQVGIYECALEEGVSEATINRYLRLAEQGQERYGSVNEVLASMDEPPIYDNRPIAIHPDIHAPYNHPDTIEFLLWVSEWRECQERVVNVGDLMDFHSMSRFVSEVDASNPVDEYEKALSFVEEYSQAFPEGDMVLGNHDLIPQRQMKELGLLPSMLRADNELYGLSEAWDIHPLYHVIKPDSWNVLVEHGIGSGGRYGCANTAKEKRCSYVQGHTHSAAAVIYSTNHESTIFGMNVGACVDTGSLAQRYGKYMTKKAVTACGVVYGGSHAEVVTMDTWKNYQRWF
tara:strand:- start:469 stop:1371 length:903 start_codon:yes stop_codon:yes gene_type:complete